MRSNAARVPDSGLQVDVGELRGQPGAWTVEATDNEGDGAVYQAVFFGPAAKERAKEYARFKFGA